MKIDSVQLRKLSVSDITDKYIQGLNSHEIMQFTESRNKVWDYCSVKAYISDEDPKSELLGIFVEAIHVESIRIHSIDSYNCRCELGILIFDSNFWNRGIGEIALRKVVEYIFLELKLAKITANYFSDNLGSAKLFKKVGFRKVGLLKGHFKVRNGTFRDGVFVELWNRDL